MSTHGQTIIYIVELSSYVILNNVNSEKGLLLQGFSAFNMVTCSFTFQGNIRWLIRERGRTSVKVTKHKVNKT